MDKIAVNILIQDLTQNYFHLPLLELQELAILVELMVCYKDVKIYSI